MKKLIPLLLLTAIIITACAKAPTSIAYINKEEPRTLKTEKENANLEEALKYEGLYPEESHDKIKEYINGITNKYEFVVEENINPGSRDTFNKKILPIYLNTESPTDTKNGLIGMDYNEINKLIGKSKPRYKITLKEYSDGKEVKSELSDRELWATGIYSDDPSGIRILFDKGKVVAAWIDELNGPPNSIYDFFRDKAE